MLLYNFANYLHSTLNGFLANCWPTAWVGGGLTTDVFGAAAALILASMEAISEMVSFR